MTLLRLMLLLACVPLLSTCQTDSLAVTWPEIGSESKPWTRWWWMGNGVDRKGITAQLEAFAAAGIGGVEIAPIYGVKGEEDGFIDYLSPKWMAMLKHTLDEAERLGMKVDMTQGTGWPFGGPYIPKELGASRYHIETFELQEGERSKEIIIPKDRRGQRLDFPLDVLMAYGPDEQVLNLTDQISNDQLDWQAPAGSWKLVAGFLGNTNQQVKRAAPGGKGYVVDHLSAEAVRTYLARFDSAFDTGDYPVRAMFNDSYEVYNANWTPQLPEEFKRRRGYDLMQHLDDLVSQENTEASKRVKSDFRQTMSELLLESFTNQWKNWAHDRQIKVKNQAHGSPGNLLDLYGTVDIPEIETFGSTQFDIPGLRYEKEHLSTREAPDPNMLKFASSAAHVMGKPLISSESLTWLAEHFRTPLSLAKPELDQLFLSGINHVFFHGSTYSPEDYPWPGWLFYASVHFGPTNSFWQDLGAMNQYIARCQSVFQEAKPDNEVLVYWPIYDVWQDTEQNPLYQLTVHNLSEWLIPSQFYKLNEELQQGGWQTDYVSDNQLQLAEFKDDRLSLPGSGYQVLVVPATEFMPAATLEKMLSLAKAGASVVFQNLDMDVPGLNNLSERRKRLVDLLDGLQLEETNGLLIAKMGEGQVLVTKDVGQGLKYANITCESIGHSGLKYLRMKHQNGKYYFLVNHTSEPVDEQMEIAVGSKGVVLMDPESGRIGRIGINDDKVRVQLKPGQSIIIKTLDHSLPTNPEWQYLEEGDPIAVEVDWEVSAVKGGPKLPEAFTTSDLISWTKQGNKWEFFSGTAKYSSTIEVPESNAIDYLLRFERLGESASIYVNGDSVGTSWSAPAEIQLEGALKPGKNKVEILVTNLMANRIRYMDLNKIEWQNFHEINFVNIDYQSFDASVWESMPSGIIGKVELIPLKE